jgi:translation initiation factor eIF-2B subunit delta
MSLADRIRDIGADRSLGAAELAFEAARAFAAFAESAEFSPAAIESAARMLVQAQPVMAPLFNLANMALWNSGTREALRGAAERFSDRIRTAADRIAAHTQLLIHPGTAITTHSASSTVLTALVQARQKRLEFSVICTESQPGSEGVALARKLNEAGIPATLVTDAAMMWAVSRSSVVLVGADAVSYRGVTNKMGTALLALAANHADVPIYVLTGTEKFLPHGYELPVDASNLVFESTPLEHFRGVVSERGLLTSAEVQDHLAREPIHPALASAR